MADKPISNETAYTILAVDDAKDTLMLLEFDLTEAGFNVLTTESGEEALKIIAENKVHLLLLDMYMPGLSGLATLQSVKAEPTLAHTPVIMLSASENEDEIVAALESGADDYVTKPYLAKVLLARIKTSLRLMEKTLQLEQLARTDFLTQLNNKGSFEEFVFKAISQAKRNDEELSIAMFDIDFFKKVNDSFGHEAGDKALVDFACLMKESFRDYDILARIGGEEFAVCMPNTEIADAYIACERCRVSLEKHVIISDSIEGQQSFKITTSIGLTSAKGHLLDYESLMRVADYGLYEAKENGRNQTIAETPHSEEVVDDVLVIDESLQDLTEKNTLSENTEEYPGIDYQVGINNVLGDAELFREILIMFYQDHGSNRDEIALALKKEDHLDVKRLVHTLKGVACSVGAMKLFEYCKALDVALNQNEKEQYWLLFEPLAQELVKIVQGIETKLC